MASLFKSVEIEQLRRLIGSAGVFALVAHVHPDGDAIGAMQGLAVFLRALGRRVYSIIPNAYPDYLSFLDAFKDDKMLIYKYHTKKCEHVLREVDAIVCLDINSLQRLDVLSNLVSAAPQPKVLIDHHPDPERKEFDLIFSDPEMSSSSELTYRLICELDMISPFPDQAVEPLFVGMMTDTNNFSNSVTAGTFEAAAQLMRLGVDREKVQKNVFGSFSEQRMRLMAHLIYNRMVLVKPYRAAYMLLSLDEQKEFCFRPGDSEGFVNIPMNIRDVDVSMLFVETQDYIRVSLRSQNNVDANEMARRFFNGGGHRQASGGRVYAPFEELPVMILHALEETFKTPPSSLAQ
ncbi:MAG: bifunctional oligoribonuclease/PAP phosphatase NrnA [Bacteroidales bacterium]|nr:bifunctional oligoribonuclease/PAP phosphatase NrnA [Bacteroidales bacterium]